MAVPEDRFADIQLDKVGPLPTSKNYKYILTTLYLIYPLRDISLSTVASIFANYTTRFDIPLQITTIQSTQFMFKLFTKLVKFLGSRKITISPYHPQ